MAYLGLLLPKSISSPSVRLPGVALQVWKPSAHRTGRLLLGDTHFSVNRRVGTVVYFEISLFFPFKITFMTQTNKT